MMKFADVLTLERCNSAFLGFQIGFRRCNSWNLTWEETWKNHPGAVQKLDSEVGKSVERAVQKCADFEDWSVRVWGLERPQSGGRLRKCVRIDRLGAPDRYGGLMAG